MLPNNLYKILFVVSLLPLIVLYLWYNQLQIASFQLKERTSNTTKKSQLTVLPILTKPVTPLILFWENEPEGKGFKGIAKRGKCLETHNTSKVEEADAIIFHHGSNFDIPWKYNRRREQIFVFIGAESAAIVENGKRAFRQFDGGFINWTWSYRFDSDLPPHPHYRDINLKSISKGKKVVDELMAKKKALAVWFANGCDSRKGQRLRLAFARELDKNGVNFTRHGRCFKNSPKHFVPRKEMLNEVSKHKFYFAFENSFHCIDAATEKFWINSLRAGAVPVVWGQRKEDLLRTAPLDSFILAEDFQSASDLAKYLKFLDSNDNEYRKFFNWREDENMTDAKMIELVKQRYPNLLFPKNSKISLCDKLLQLNETKIINSLTDWLVNTNPIECAGSA